jgi:hypothetical protein
MEHEIAQGLLSEYLEGELAEDRYRSMEDHLQGCETCQNDLRTLKNTLQLVQNIPPVRAPVRFASSVRKRAKKAGLFSRRRNRLFPRQMIAFEATLVVILATMASIVFTLLLMHTHIETLHSDRIPLSIQVQADSHAQMIAESVWDAGGEIWELDQALPAGSTLKTPYEIELRIPDKSWPKLKKTLELLSTGTSLPQTTPKSDIKGMVQVIVQIQINWEIAPLK